MVGTTNFDYAVAICGVIALIIVFVYYRRSMRRMDKREQFWADQWPLYPPAPGMSEGEKVVWMQRQREKQINRKMPGKN